MGSIRTPGRVDRGTTVPLAAARRRLSAVAAGAMGLLLASAIAPAGAFSDTGREWLFVQDAPRAKLKPAGKGLVLTLINPSEHVEAFTDRPSRRFTVEPLADFLGSWGTYGFKRNPPNAAINVVRADGDQDVLIVELARPRLHKSGNVSYRVKPLKKKGRNRTDLGRRVVRRADNKLSRRLGPTSLFIDDAAEETARVDMDLFAAGRWSAVFHVSDFVLTDFSGGVTSASAGELVHPVAYDGTNDPPGTFLLFTVSSGTVQADAGVRADAFGSCVFLMYLPQYGEANVRVNASVIGGGPLQTLVSGMNKLPTRPGSSCK